MRARVNERRGSKRGEDRKIEKSSLPFTFACFRRKI